MNLLWTAPGRITYTHNYAEQLDTGSSKSNHAGQEGILIRSANNTIFSSSLESSPSANAHTDPSWNKQTHSSPPLHANKVNINFGMNPANWFCCHRSASAMCRQLCYKVIYDVHTMISQFKFLQFEWRLFSCRSWPDEPSKQTKWQAVVVWCIQTFTNDWMESWSQFEEYCLYSTEEYHLRQCIEDGEQVCSFGCKQELQFCSHFNANPNTGTKFNWFKNCNINSDRAAATTYQTWIDHEFIKEITKEYNFRNDTYCQTNVWLGLACAIHLKPCQPRTQFSDFCRYIAHWGCKQ